jgi:hypothetical protein
MDHLTGDPLRFSPAGDHIDTPGPTRSFEKRGVDSFCYSSHDI